MKKGKYICKECGREFYAYQKANRKYCSLECSRKQLKYINRHNVYLICKWCNKEFRTTKYQRNKIKRKYCSSKCFHDSQIGKNQSPTTITKRVSKNIGKKRTQELKDRMSSLLKGKYIGELASGYIDGRTQDKGHLRQRNRKYHARRRVRDTFAGNLTIQTIQTIYEANIKKHGTLTCYYCKEPIVFGDDQLEHKIPVSRGGTNKYINLTVACKSCNCKKNNKTEEEYMEFLKS